MGEMHNLKNGIYFQTSKHRFPINVHLENRFIKLTAAENKFPGVPLSFLFSKMNHYFRCFGLTIFSPNCVILICRSNCLYFKRTVLRHFCFGTRLLIWWLGFGEAPKPLRCGALSFMELERVLTSRSN